MLNPRKELKRERRAKSEEWRVKSENFLLRAHTKGHRRLCRRVPPRERSSRHKIRGLLA